MKTAGILLAVFFLLAFGLAGYGASIDRFGMLIGMMPGLIGLIGVCLWVTSPEGIAASHAQEYAQGFARRQKARAQYAKQSGYVYVSATRNKYIRSEFNANIAMHMHAGKYPGR